MHSHYTEQMFYSQAPKSPWRPMCSWRIEFGDLEDGLLQ